jgi:hypothetical protein
LKSGALARAAVFKCLCNATFKLGLLCWQQKTWLLGVDQTELTHRHLLHTMDALQVQGLRLGLAGHSHQLRPLIDKRLPAAFDDLT